MPSLETLSTGHALLEGPIWSPQLGLIVADAIVGGVYAFKPGQDPELIIAHRRGIGGMALHENSGVIIGGRNLALKRPLAEGDEVEAVVLNIDTADGEKPKISLGIKQLIGDPWDRIPFDYPVEWPVRMGVVLSDGVPAHIVAAYSHVMMSGVEYERARTWIGAARARYSGRRGSKATGVWRRRQP